MAAVLKASFAMLSYIFSKGIVFGALLMVALPSWAADRCEQSFTSQRTYQDSSGHPVVIDGLQVRPPKSASNPQPYYPPRHLSYRMAFADRSLKDSLIALTLSGGLISQYDPKLADRDLLIPNGGLCSSTCGVNVLQSVIRYTYGNSEDFATQADSKIQDIVDIAWDRFGENARKGLNFNYLNLALRDISVGLGIEFTSEKVGLGHKYNSEIKEAGFTESSLETDNDTIALITVRASEGTAHALILTGYDRQTKKAYFNDPLSPWRISEALVTPTYDGVHRTLKLYDLRFGPGPNVGNIIDIIYLTAKAPINPAVIAPYSRFIGKRVLISKRNGQRIKMNVDKLKKIADSYFSAAGIFGYESLFGGQTSVLVAYDDIASIVEIQPPTDFTRFKSLVGKTVRAKFEFDGDKDSVYEVTGYEDPSISKEFPTGALIMRDTKGQWKDAFPIPLDVILSLEIVH